MAHHLSQTRTDGRSDDLLTAGMGVDPLIGKALAPGDVDPLRPTAAELRRAAIFALNDPAGGFGRLFGPNIDPVSRQAVADVQVAENDA